MRLVVDTNILIDALIDRKPFSESAALLLQLGYVGEFDLWIGTSQISDLVYVLTEGGKPALAPYARNVLGKLQRLLHIYATSEEDVSAIAESSWENLEDALVYQTATQVKAQAILTRDAGGFTQSPIQTFTCEGFFQWLEETEGICYAEV